MPLFVLRAVMMETYDCPDNGTINICERYEDVRFATMRETLDAQAADLNRGHIGFWSEKRANELRSLHGDYGNEYKYLVYDVSDLMI